VPTLTSTAEENAPPAQRALNTLEQDGGEVYIFEREKILFSAGRTKT